MSNAHVKESFLFGLLEQVVALERRSEVLRLQAREAEAAQLRAIRRAHLTVVGEHEELATDSLKTVPQAAYIAAEEAQKLRAAAEDERLKASRPTLTEARLAKAEAARAKRNGLKIGTTLSHICHGRVTATCLYRGPRDWVFAGESFTSVSGAAKAAAKSLGYTQTTTHGWVFFGIEKRPIDLPRKREPERDDDIAEAAMVREEARKLRAELAAFEASEKEFEKMISTRKSPSVKK